MASISLSKSDGAGSTPAGPAKFFNGGEMTHQSWCLDHNRVYCAHMERQIKTCADCGHKFDAWFYRRHRGLSDNEKCPNV